MMKSIDKMFTLFRMIIFMTDQDLDGSHIKGLGINLFESQWNSLVQIPEFYWIYEYSYFKS